MKVGFSFILYLEAKFITDYKSKILHWYIYSCFLVNWLGHDKTLQEAGVEKNTLVVLR